MMLLKLGALGALGYAGYKYLQKNRSGELARDKRTRSSAVAGGPLSDGATLQHNAPTA